MKDTDGLGGGQQADEPADRPARSPFPWGRLAILLAVVFSGIILFKVFDLHRFINCAALGTHRSDLLAYVDQHYVLSVVVFMSVYTVSTAMSLPAASLISITGGFLFGTAFGTAMVVVAATLGATAIFIIAKTILGDMLRARAGPRVSKMAKGFEENAFSYLLVLRLVPLFPFWLVNVAPAFLGVPLRTYVVGTFLGIIPGAFVFVSVGAGLGSIFDAGGECSLQGIVTPQVGAALAGLAVLALIPVIYKKWKARRP